MSEDQPEQPFDEWLTDRLEEAKESYHGEPRSENPRRSDISLGKIRALKNVRTEYLNRKQDQ